MTGGACCPGLFSIKVAERFRFRLCLTDHPAGKSPGWFVSFYWRAGDRGRCGMKAFQGALLLGSAGPVIQVVVILARGMRQGAVLFQACVKISLPQPSIMRMIILSARDSTQWDFERSGWSCSLA